MDVFVVGSYHHHEWFFVASGSRLPTRAIIYQSDKSQAKPSAFSWRKLFVLKTKVRETYVVIVIITLY